MAAPTDDEMAEYVLYVLDTWRTLGQVKLSYGDSLAALGIVGVGVRTLAGALRSYILKHDNGETLLVKEVTKADKAGPILGLVIKKIADTSPTQAQLTALIAAHAP